MPPFERDIAMGVFGSGLNSIKELLGIERRRTMTITDLRSGNVVETREGNLYLVCGDKLIRKDGYMTLDEYNDDLTVRGGDEDKGWDIMKVYDIAPYMVISIVNRNATNAVPFWEREEAIEMTIEEIEKKLGIKNIKIIKEKHND